MPTHQGWLIPCGFPYHPGPLAFRVVPAPGLLAAHAALNLRGSQVLQVLKSQKTLGRLQLPTGKRLQDYGKSPFCSWVNQLFNYGVHLVKLGALG